ncbi:MAG: PepSY domain-containing protein [Luteitalea sp.]|nr:PepSY domain-containing protein [Luteitalea sp.]
MNAGGKTATKARSLRQAMSDLHIWVGLLPGWILYAMFLTGTVSYFRDELSQWMRPELPAYTAVGQGPVVAGRLTSAMREIAPRASAWSIGMPNERTNVAAVSWLSASTFQSADLNPVTGERLTVRQTRGGDFFYAFHYQFHYMPRHVGRLLAGLCGMFMLVAIISGVIVHKKIFTDFFTFRWGKGQGSWLDAHNALAVFGLPFHIMVTYSGLVILMQLYMPWGSAMAFETAAERQRLTAEIAPIVPPSKPRGEQVELANIASMVRLAEARWGQDQVGRLLISNPDDAAAKVVVIRDEAGRASNSPQYLLFDATGKLIRAKVRVGPAAEVHGVLYALHLGRFADYVTRWLYFLVSLAGTAMVGTGLVLWVVKRKQRLPDHERPHVGLRLVEKLNIASIGGLSIAMAAFLWANRLLPAHLPGRSAWEIHIFFIVWAVTFAHALARPAKTAWIEQLWFGAAALLLLPALGAATTDRGLVSSLSASDWVFVGVDLTLLALGGLHAWMAMAVLRHKPMRRRAKQEASDDVAHQANIRDVAAT